MAEIPSRHGILLTFPSQGMLYVLADLHGDVLGFERFMEKEQFEERLVAGELVYLLQLGDITDGGPDDTVLGSWLERLKAQHPDHIHVLLGNHDAGNLYVAEKIRKQHAARPELPLDELLDSYHDQHPYLAQFDTCRAWLRGDLGGLALLRQVPVVARTQNGVAFVHAGPPRTHLPERYLAEMDTGKIVAEATIDLNIWGSHASSPAYSLLWGRPPSRPRKGNISYSKEDIRRFLAVVDANILVVAHEGNVDGFFAPGNGLAVLETTTANERACYLRLPLNPQERFFTRTADIDCKDLCRLY